MHSQSNVTVNRIKRKETLPSWHWRSAENGSKGISGLEDVIKRILSKKKNWFRGRTHLKVSLKFDQVGFLRVKVTLGIAVVA